MAAKERGGQAAQFSYCRQFFLSHSVLAMLADMRQQVLDELRTRGYIADNDVAKANRNSGHHQVVLAAVAAGLYPHVAKRIPSESCLLARVQISL